MPDPYDSEPQPFQRDPGDGDLQIPMDGKQFGFWQAQVKQAETVRDEHKELWQLNVDAYRGKPLDHPPEYDTVIVPKDFSNVEAKRAQLFFQRPDIQLTAKEPLQGQEQAVAVFQAVINDLLGSHGVDAMTMVDECLFDALCPAGIACSKIGYQSVDRGTMPMETGQVDPMTGQPMMTEVPQPLYEEYFWRRFSPLKVLIPSEFHGSDYDQAAWLGMAFVQPLESAKRAYHLPDDFMGAIGSDRELLIDETSHATTETRRVKGVEIWYKASLFDPEVLHPWQQRVLVIIDGWDRPVRHENSPYQQFGPDGRLTGGMQGFPIHILSLRYLGDSAYPPSDCSISRHLVDEQGKSRTQMLLQRDRSIPMRLGDIDRLGGEAGFSKVQRNIWQAIIPVQGLSAGDPPILEVARSEFPREDFSFNDIIERDIDTAWAMGANQRGLEQSTIRSATELNIIQQSTMVRLDKERNRALAWYVKGVEKLASLVQMFADEADYVQVVGPMGQQALAAWDKTTIQGRYAFTAKPDTMLRVDAETDRKQAMDLYNQLANDPNINRQELLVAIIRKFNLDPQKLIAQPPPARPAPPDINFTIKGEDLDPTLPRFTIIVEVLRQGGIEIPPQAIQQAQQQAMQQSLLMTGGAPQMGMPGGMGLTQPPMVTGHGGPAETTTPLNKHLLDQTGAMQNTGETIPS